MRNILKFLKREAVLSVSGVLAAASLFIVPPDPQYLSYCDFSVLSILFCLMIIVEGLQSGGLFEVLTQSLTKRIKTEKVMVLALTLICFFSSALITNDVALITFVPFTLALLKNQGEKALIFAVTMETVAANLGSLITPIGNPQNLYLYSRYGLNIGEFFRITLPLGAICLGLILILLFCRRNRKVEGISDCGQKRADKFSLGFFGVLFVICLLSVLKIIPYYITLIIVALAVLFKDRRLYRKVDYLLLLTFVFFFVFVGNMARLEAVNAFITNIMRGREILISALLSQIISNVPAAAMLSAFTENAKGLILGTNIGGLGTLIASMASLISYRKISAEKGVSSVKYLGFFSMVNFAMLGILLGIYIFLL